MIGILWLQNSRPNNRLQLTAASPPLLNLDANRSRRSWSMTLSCASNVTLYRIGGMALLPLVWKKRTPIATTFQE